MTDYGYGTRASRRRRPSTGSAVGDVVFSLVLIVVVVASLAYACHRQADRRAACLRAGGHVTSTYIYKAHYIYNCLSPDGRLIDQWGTYG